MNPFEETKEVILKPKFPELIDSTMTNDYSSCPTLFNLARIYGLSPKGGSVHLIAGGAFAKGCEVARKAFYQEGKSHEDAVADAVIAAWEHYGDFEPEEKYQTKSAERVAYALVEYFEEYPFESDKLQPYIRADGSPAIEFEFSFPLETKHPKTGNPLLYGGRLDMVGVYLDNLWATDEKTTTRLGPQWLKSFDLRGQMIGYCYAAQLFDLPVNGFIIRGISFLKNYYDHAEVISPISQYLIDDWRESLEAKAQDMVRDWERNYFYKSFGEACNAYGGCQFKNLCTKQNWQDWWQSYFDINYWNPLERAKPVTEETPIISFAS